MKRLPEEQDFEKALKVVRSTRRKIDNLKPLEAEEFHIELERSRKALDDLEEALLSQKPLNEVEKLRKKMELAVAAERTRQGLEAPSSPHAAGRRI